MRTYEKSTKLDNVCYDIRGPVMDEANRMQAAGIDVLKLNIGNPAPFGFHAPDEVIKDMSYNLRDTEGYSDSKGLFSARKAIMQYCQLKHIPNVGIDDIYTGNGVSELITMSMQGLLNNGDEILVPSPDYPLWTASVTLAGGTAVHYICDEQSEWYPDIEDMRKKITDKTKAIVIINPNNPTGVIYSHDEIVEIAKLAEKYGATVIVDELYSRQIFDNHPYTHLRAQNIVNPDNLITIIGPSKTESLSGFRLGVAFGSPKLITRMEKLQAIVSLRCAGYNQAVFQTWFHEPEGWMKERVAAHQAIRDDLLQLFGSESGVSVRPTEGGSYIFPRVEGLIPNIKDFTKILRIQAGVTVTPGTEFGPQFTDCFRLNFSQDAKKAHDAIVRTLQIIERYR